MAILGGLSKYKDFGLLLLRIGIGIMMITHGYPKLLAGPTGSQMAWENVGKGIENFGIHFGFTFWGFMAAFAEGVGGLLILLGLAFRPACVLLIINMIVAAMFHLKMPPGSPMAGFGGASHAIELGIVFLSLFIIGPGRYSIDKK